MVSVYAFVGDEGCVVFCGGEVFYGCTGEDLWRCSSGEVVPFVGFEEFLSGSYDSREASVEEEEEWRRVWGR